MSRIWRRLRSYLRRLSWRRSCPCRSTAEDIEFYRERDELIAEWCELLSLADVLALTGMDIAYPASFPDDDTLVMKCHPTVVVPRKLTRRSMRWGSQIYGAGRQALFSGPRDLRLTVKQFEMSLP